MDRIPIGALVVVAIVIAVWGGRMRSSREYRDARSRFDAAAIDLRDEVLKPFARVVDWLMALLSRGTI